MAKRHRGGPVYVLPSHPRADSRTRIETSDLPLDRKTSRLERALNIVFIVVSVLVVALVLAVTFGEFGRIIALVVGAE